MIHEDFFTVDNIGGIMGLKLFLKNAKASFEDFWTNSQDRDLSKQPHGTISAAKREMKGGKPANEQILKGLYTGSGQDMALASYLSGGMVDVSKNLTGVPGIIPDKGQDDTLLKKIYPLVVDEFPVLIVTMLTQGTAWRWARWSDKLHKLTWEVIPDSSITSIIIELDTGEITEIYTSDLIEHNKDENNVAITTRKRHITKELITEEWKGNINKFVQYKNTFGFLPIPFSHRCYEGEWRGNSIYARSLRYMKAIHDIAYKRDEILADFEPKLIQTVKNVEKWMSNNTPPDQKGSKNVVIDPHRMRLVVNQEGEETRFEFLPSDATAQHTAAIKDNELKVIKGSGVPELLYGAIATGNHASTETDIFIALDHIKGIRRELTKATQQLINQSLQILAFMHFTQPPQVSIQWGNLSLMSEEQKARVMSTYAAAIVPLLGNGAISKEGAFFFTKELYPGFPAEDAVHYMEGLSAMLVEHSSKIGQPAFDMGGY